MSILQSIESKDTSYSRIQLKSPIWNRLERQLSERRPLLLYSRGYIANLCLNARFRHGMHGNRVMFSLPALLWKVAANQDSQSLFVQLREQLEAVGRPVDAK